MKFSATIRNGLLLHRLCCCYEKLGRSLLLKFNAASVTFVHQENSLQCWSQLDADSLFQDISFQISQLDFIFLRIDCSLLARALQSFAADVNTIVPLFAAKVKLATVGENPVLLVKISDAHDNVIICHNLQISLLTPLEAAQLREPTVGAPDVQIVLPSPLKKLRQTGENLRKFLNSDSSLTLRASASGSLTLFTQNSNGSLVEVSFSGLSNPPAPPSTGSLSEQQSEASATIDCRDFAKMMSSLAVSPIYGVCCIFSGQFLLFYFYLQSNSTNNMTFLISGKET